MAWVDTLTFSHLLTFLLMMHCFFSARRPACLCVCMSLCLCIRRYNKVQIMELLQSIPADVIASKQRALARVAPRVQYAMPPVHLLSNISDETPWDPPYPDAVDMAVGRRWLVLH